MLAAMASSACCWLPLLLLAFGGSVVGIATFFEAWRGWSLGSAAILLALGFYLSYFRKSACKPDDACAAPTPGLRRVNRAMLWVAAAFVAVFAFFPNTLGLLALRRKEWVESNRFDGGAAPKPPLRAAGRSGGTEDWLACGKPRKNWRNRLRCGKFLPA